ncbi:flagellar assembly protein FliW [Paenibacillus urinalis]|uniref:Flagellar assembly factor FliW n=1 Tax=Paenibacillus urinalis TaxID=521520 RepID=A0AAX3MX83_9BACL|nr:flagellar assembly protein FliW [Paenibacillus urinalis]WDH82240.1 flagellar assembly protein FliW [Paenibacillus urinalis]
MTMIIETSSWGKMEVQEDHIVQFHRGIPGFEEETAFAILPYENSPFHMMQSVQEPGLSFLLADPFLFEPQYEFELPQHEAAELQIDEEVNVLCIVTIGESLSDSSINLLAPIVINPINRQGKQIVLHDTAYVTRHKLSELSAAEQLFAKEGE